MSEPRAYTAEEARQMFLDQLRGIACYWSNLPDVDKATGRPMTIQDRTHDLGVTLGPLA